MPRDLTPRSLRSALLDICQALFLDPVWGFVLRMRHRCAEICWFRRFKNIRMTRGNKVQVRLKSVVQRRAFKSSRISSSCRAGRLWTPIWRWPVGSVSDAQHVTGYWSFSSERGNTLQTPHGPRTPRLNSYLTNKCTHTVRCVSLL